MTVVWLLLLCVTVATGWVLNLLGMPGNWLIVAAAALYAWLVPGDSRLAIGWPAVGGLVALALLGEVVELVAGALGVSKAGGSRRGAILALAGSLVGGMVGLVVGVPIPVVGSLVAAVGLAGVGALAGAVVGESWKGRDLDHSLRVGQAAFWGRICGTLAKTMIGAVMVAVVLAALVLA